MAKRKALKPSAAGAKRFDLIPTAEGGIEFVNRFAGLELYKNMVAHNDAGVAVGDVNGDVLTDIYFCYIQGGNALYLNQVNFRFRLATQTAGVSEEDKMSTVSVLADVDNDGDKDLLVNGIQSGTRLFLNDGSGGFQLSEILGLDSAGTTSSLALAEINGDLFDISATGGAATPTSDYHLAGDHASWKK